MKSILYLRKNVSLCEEHLKMVKPLLDKNQNNFSSAIRDCVEFYDFVQKKFGGIDSAKEILYAYDTRKNDAMTRPNLRPGDKLILSVESILRQEKGSVSDRRQ